MGKKALLIVDIQNDFMPEGALAVTGGDTILPIINSLTLQFSLVVASMDWHPPNHISFAKTHGKKVGDIIDVGGTKQILWPVHCVENSYGAELAKGLLQENIHHYVYKGTDPNIDSYSAFFDNQKKKETDLHDFLVKKGVTHLYLAGLTTEYCVKYTALDAMELGYFVFVIIDACCPINIHPDDEKKAIREMKRGGINLIMSSDISEGVGES